MRETTITTARVRSAWATIQRGANPFARQHPPMGWLSTRYRSAQHDDFIGCSGPQMQGWLEHGYYPEGDAPDLTMGQQDLSLPMMDLHEEEGDLIVSAALSGDDLYRVRWEDFEAKRGLKIRACIDFNAGVSPQTMRHYFDWVLRIVDAAERRGIAPDVELFIDAAGCFEGEDEDQRDRIIFPLVKAGEIVDVTAWRAFLTPGAFRSLGFIGMVLTADDHKRTARNSLGRGICDKWAIEFADDVLTIHANANASNFPEDQMTADVDAALA